MDFIKSVQQKILKTKDVAKPVFLVKIIYWNILDSIKSFEKQNLANFKDPILLLLKNIIISIEYFNFWPKIYLILTLLKKRSYCKIFQTHLTSTWFFCGTCSDDFTADSNFIIKTVGCGDQSEFIQNCGPTKMEVSTLIISSLYGNLPWNGWGCRSTSYNISRVKSCCLCHKIGHGCWKNGINNQKLKF